MDKSIQKTTLYRYFDSEGQLLYVGITGDNTKRQSQHRRNSFWFGEIASATFEHYETRDFAAQAEVIAIQTERPRYNTQHLHSKRQEFSPMDLVAKFHLLSILSGVDAYKKQVEIDADHKNFKKAVDAFDLQNDFYSLDESLVMELEHLVWREVQHEVSLPNLDSCELCQALFASEWYSNTLWQIESKTVEARRKIANAAR